MKRIKIRAIIMFIAVSLIASAFTARKSYEKRFDTMYYWFNTIDQYVGNNTLVNQVNATGCNGSVFNPTCQKGYTQAHLLNASSPAQGHAAVPADAIINVYN